MTQDEMYFNIDGVTLFNMLDGMTYEEAYRAALEEYSEMAAAGCFGKEEA